MRRTAIFSLLIVTGALSTAVACSDQRDAAPTGPRITNDSSPTAAADVASQPIASAKPAPGFTKTVVVATSYVTVTANNYNYAIAACPVGTTLVGGGFNFTAGVAWVAPPLVKTSEPSKDGWMVIVDNYAAGASDVQFRATAICAS